MSEALTKDYAVQKKERGGKERSPHGSGSFYTGMKG